MKGGKIMQQHSFSKIENDLQHKFRKLTNEAESTEDVKKSFVFCMQELFNLASIGQLELQYEDIELLPEGNPYFVFSDKVRSREEFASIWNDSDLSQIVLRFAELASNHHKHLTKNPKKTEAKIRMNQNK